MLTTQSKFVLGDLCFLPQIKDKDYAKKLMETMDVFIIGINISEDKKVDVQWEKCKHL